MHLRNMISQILEGADPDEMLEAYLSELMEMDLSDEEVDENDLDEVEE